MEIVVKGYLTFKQLIGEQRLSFAEGQAPRLKDVMDMLIEMHGSELEKVLLNPDTSRLNPQAAVLVNGSHHTHLLEGLEVILKDGDQVAVFPPLAGGSRSPEPESRFIGIFRDRG
jgi:MoaD family protein